MIDQHSRFAIALVTVASLAGGCTSSDQKAADAAAAAASALQQGQTAVARRQIGQAVALRDDVSEYWLLLARIAIAGGDTNGAFNAYENVVTLDRTNVEALTRLCQIALYTNSAARADRYADQLALLNPGDNLPKMVKAALALDQGDKPAARKLLDEVLTANPKDDQALIVQSRLLMADNDYAGAARSLELTVQASTDPGSRLLFLKDLYRRIGNIADYDRTLARLAKSRPDDASAQIDHAAALYDNGDRDGGFVVTQRVLGRWPNDIAVVGRVLDLWLKQDGGAMPVDAITPAKDASPEVKAAFAQYANEIGRPETALALLNADRTPPQSSPAAGVRSAYAYALALRGDFARARTVLDPVLVNDPDEPRALLARAWLRGATGDVDGGIRDARRVVADDTGKAAARLTLADLLLRKNQPELAERVLREGLRGEGADPRLVKRLAILLRSQGRDVSAADAMTDYARRNPVSRQAARLKA